MYIIIPNPLIIFAMMVIMAGGGMKKLDKISSWV